MTVTAQTVTDRDTVLAAITEGKKTPREIADATGLNLSTVIREAEIMKDLYITILPGPPCVSYWPKGKAPRGKLIRQEGKLVELPVEKTNGNKAQLIADGNEELAKKAVKPSYDVSSYASEETSVEIPHELVIPHPLNPRGQIDTSNPKFIDLVDSIREVNIQQPLIITPHEDSGLFRVVIGNRRRLAGITAGLDTLRCIIRHYDSPETELAVMLIENIQRQDLTPVAEAKAFKTLFLQSDKNIDAVARQTGCKQPFIYQSLRLLKLDRRLQEMVDRGELSRASGAMIAGLDIAEQIKIAPKVGRLKFKEIKEMVSRIQTGIVPPPQWKPPANRVTEPEEKFTRSAAIRSLVNIGDAWFPVSNIRDAFDDVCIDSCLEKRDESLCHACPIPRFIESIIRRTKRGENDGQSS